MKPQSSPVAGREDEPRQQRADDIAGGESMKRAAPLAKPQSDDQRPGRRLVEAKHELEGVKGSLPWLLSWPLGRLSALMHRDVHFRLYPNADLEFIGEDFDWRSKGDDPHFMMEPVTKVFPGGWVLIRSTLHRLAEGQTLKLYYDDGRGFSEQNSIVLPVEPTGEVHELVRIPDRIHAMRWDPGEWPGEFIQGPVTISRAGLLSRCWVRLFRFVRVKLRCDPDRLRQLGVTLGNLLRHPHRTYQVAGTLQVRPSERSYQNWLRRHRLTDADRSAIAAHIGRLQTRPLISVLMPVYNTPAALLRQSIASVQAQLYPDWELCVVDDASTDPQTRKCLEELAGSDRRVRVHYRTSNGHISAASNDAIAMAKGDFAALLDHDDVLSEQALYQLVVELNRHPDADIVYTDEDKIFSENPNAGEGRHGEPHFKPDWNLDLLYSQNYVSHLGVYRTELVRRVGGFREGFEGSQDFDLLLRCVAAKARNIRHIPAVLYHWRASSGSTASSGLQKNYASDRGIRALQDHFRSLGVAGVKVEEGHFPTTYHVKFPIPDPPPKVSIIIPTRNQHQLLRQCIESVRSKTAYPNYELVVIDNQSDEPAAVNYLAELERAGTARVLRYARPFNYSAINNWAVEQVDGEIIAMMNNDIEVIGPEWLTEMVSHALRPDVGAVGAKLYYTDGTMQHAGVVTGLGGVAGHSHKHYGRHESGYFRRLFLTQNLSAVTGACLVVRRQTYLRAGGLDSERLAIAFNDVDFCLKLNELGLRNVWTPYARLYHHESASRGPEDSPEKVVRFQQEIARMKERWGDRLMRDPCYSPRLTLDREDFTPDYRSAPPKPWLQ